MHFIYLVSGWIDQIIRLCDVIGIDDIGNGELIHCPMFNY